MHQFVQIVQSLIMPGLIDWALKSFALFDCLQTQRRRLQLDQMKLALVRWA